MDAAEARDAYKWPDSTCRGARLLRLGEEDVLHLGVQAHRMHAHLAADPAALVASERRLGVDAVRGVHADDTRADPFRHPDRPAEVPGPDRAREAVLRLVGEPDRLVLGVERDQAHDRPEDLLPRDAPVVVDVGEHRRPDEEAALGALDGGDLAAGDEPRALLLPDLEVVERRLALAGRDHGPELRVL